MKELCNKMVECFTDQIAADLSCGINLDAILNAYNRFQEDERDGVDYIFDINKNEDLVCCANGGMTADEIARMVNASISKFMFGVNYRHPVHLGHAEIVRVLRDNAENIAEYTIRYCGRCEEYCTLYELYITQTLEELK